jgi:hypothetical protein
MQPVPPEWVARVCFACVEVAYGRRNIRQLAPLMTKPALRTLEILQQTRSGKTAQQAKLSIGPVHIASPAASVLEVSMTVCLDSKAFPFALRFEYRETQWVICAMEMGPH